MWLAQSLRTAGKNPDSCIIMASFHRRGAALLLGGVRVDRQPQELLG